MLQRQFCFVEPNQSFIYHLGFSHLYSQLKAWSGFLLRLWCTLWNNVRANRMHTMPTHDASLRLVLGLRWKYLYTLLLSYWLDHCEVWSRPSCWVQDQFNSFSDLLTFHLVPASGKHFQTDLNFRRNKRQICINVGQWGACIRRRWPIWWLTLVSWMFCREYEFCYFCRSHHLYVRCVTEPCASCHFVLCTELPFESSFQAAHKVAVEVIMCRLLAHISLPLMCPLLTSAQAAEEDG